MKQKGPTIYCYGDEVRVMISEDGVILSSCGLSSLICSDPVIDYDIERTFRGITVDELSCILHDYGNIHIAESFDEAVLNDHKKDNIFKRLFKK